MAFNLTGAPSITPIVNQTINVGKTIPALTFTVRDALTAVIALTVTGASSNSKLLPTTNIVFGGDGASRTVTITPVTGIGGTASITLTVKNGGGLTASSSSSQPSTHPRPSLPSSIRA